MTVGVDRGFVIVAPLPVGRLRPTKASLKGHAQCSSLAAKIFRRSNDSQYEKAANVSRRRIQPAMWQMISWPEMPRLERIAVNGGMASSGKPGKTARIVDLELPSTSQGPSGGDAAIISAT